MLTRSKRRGAKIKPRRAAGAAAASETQGQGLCSRLSDGNTAKVK